MGDSVHLEVGCGPSPPVEVDHGPSLVGVDLDLRALEALARSGAGWRPVCGDGGHLPFKAGSCSSIALRAVLHHLVPTGSALEELARVLAPGGTLTVVDGVALAADDARQMNGELQAAGRPREPMAGFDLDRLTAAVAGAGLDLERLQVDGTATFATPPYVSRPYQSDRFVLVARRRGAEALAGASSAP